ncbi:MAG: metallophosphoesterase family protein [Alphaproteobacteria bacterium]|nr:metallophosphoesterase family protein [Alphaproteobacteria bacterium]MBV8413069.1 metallophosphoesterase family protein [Alphaproteobacteria bacterium]
MLDASFDHVERQRWAERRQALEQGPFCATPDGLVPWWRKRLSSRFVDLCGWLVRPTPIYLFGRRNALRLQLTEMELAFRHLPAAFDGYRILHLSDSHLDRLPELAPIARRLLSGLEVDLLALTGDVQGEHRAPITLATTLLADILDGIKVRDRRLAVLGNHDPVAMVETLERQGFEVLLNRSMALERDGERLVVTGLDDVHSFYTEAARAALDDGVRHGDTFRIALVHSAEMADHAARAGYALYLSGHSHGGQICLPGGRPLVTHLARCRIGARGLWRWADMIGYTTTGLGVSGPPLRFNCPGEAAVITLRRRP